MWKVLLLLVGTAVLWIPAVSFAGDSPSGPSKLPNKTETYGVKSDVSKSATCENQRSDSSSVETHRAEAGPVDPNALGGCSSTNANHKTEKDGKDSADSGEDGRDSQGKNVERNGNSHGNSNGQSHGKSTESHGKNAESHGDSAESHGNHSNSAMTCKALEANDSAHFQTAYGSRPNAFGKCVSAHAHRNHGSR